jgi:NAD-dependent deacetylase
MKRCVSAAQRVLDESRRRIGAALRPGGVCVLTGAGMSAESGIPTFRDTLTGYWSQFDPMALASEAGFRAHPQRVWDWYAERREGVRRAEPNAGHRSLGQFAQRHPEVLRLVSQNVDDLHQRAGNADTVRLHGDILRDRWLEPCARAARGKVCDTGWAAPGRPPRCAECGNLARPDVVWFGEPLPTGALAAAEQAADACAVMLVVGTSGAVWPAAGLAGRARRGGAWVAVINPQASELDDDVHAVLRGTAATVLPALLDRAIG